MEEKGRLMKREREGGKTAEKKKEKKKNRWRESEPKP
jgi:hypothetical protein